MKVKTCLRYPGGKFYGYKHIEPYLNVQHVNYIEPFVGGASIYLGKTQAKNNWINDKDKELINFYQVISNENSLNKFLHLIENEIVNKERYSQVLNMSVKNELERAFKYFYLNRTSFSGIMNKPRWGYRIGSSVTPENWAKRVIPVSNKLKHTKITSLDFRDLFNNNEDQDTLFYLDPPYFVASKNIYKEEFTNSDHNDLAEIIKKTKSKFVLSYENSNEVKKLYNWANIKETSWKYFLSEARRQDSSELIITNF